MTLPTGYEAKHRKNLKDLIDLWSAFRKNKEKASLQKFLFNCQGLSQEIATFTLFALQQVIDNMSATAQEGLNNKKEHKKVIKEIDWLMNQLIRANQELNDPFLNEELLHSNEDELKKHIDFHEARMHKIDNINVVVIDDQASVGQALSATLENFSLNSRHLTSVAEFKELKDDIDVDLILLDIVMPDISQEALFEFAKEMEENDIKVILCSSTYTLATRVLAVRAGVSDFVVKPVNSYSLIEKIGKALRLHTHKKYNIVIVDDQETMGTFYKTLLEQVGCEVDFFPSAKALFDCIDDLSPDMFLLDMMMPDVDGLEVAKMLRHESKFDFTPILFITADESSEQRIKAIESGAEDVINKATPIKMLTRQLLTRLRRSVEIKAYTIRDPLTGVLNHGQVVEAANNAIRASNRRRSQVSLALIDVDHFKSVNDSMGHITGDKVLCALGQLLSNSVRSTDTVGRYGGEEFIIVFEDCDIENAAMKVQYIKESFSKIQFSGVGEKFSVTFSAGIIDLGLFDSVFPAIAVADKALYRAKDQGRNKVIKYKVSR